MKTYMYAAILEILHYLDSYSYTLLPPEKPNIKTFYAENTVMQL